MSRELGSEYLVSSGLELGSEWSSGLNGACSLRLIGACCWHYCRRFLIGPPHPRLSTLGG
eukprot:1006475-Pyramimonas_sp.AAC.1